MCRFFIEKLNLHNIFSYSNEAEDYNTDIRVFTDFQETFLTQCILISMYMYLFIQKRKTYVTLVRLVPSAYSIQGFIYIQWRIIISLERLSIAMNNEEVFDTNHKLCVAYTDTWQRVYQTTDYTYCFPVRYRPTGLKKGKFLPNIIVTNMSHNINACDMKSVQNMVIIRNMQRIILFIHFYYFLHLPSSLVMV